GLRHALNTVRAALVLEDAVGAVAADLERVVAVGDRQRLDLEAAPLRVAVEHPVEVAGEQPGLLPTGPGADLDDDVLAVVRVALDHREADLLVELLEPLLGSLEQLAQLRVLAVGEQLARSGGVILRVLVLGGELVRGLELAVLAPDLGVALAVP